MSACICVSDIPIGSNMRFTLSSGKIIEGRVLHNYGRGIVLQQSDSVMIEFDGGLCTSVETMDVESASLWRQSISKAQAEFKQMLERYRKVED